MLQPPARTDPSSRVAPSLLLTAVLVGCLAASLNAAPPAPQSTRPLILEEDGRWIGNGISYGPYRNGQRPGGATPTSEQLREDLHLLAKHWRLIRIYGSDAFAEPLLQVIRDDQLNLKVLVGVWLGSEQGRNAEGQTTGDNPPQINANRQQVAGAIAMAQKFPEIVSGISVGNETQVHWSFQPLELERLKKYVRQVRSETTVPVSVADDFLYWKDPASTELAHELDFLVVHIHPLWHHQTIDKAVSFTKQQWGHVQARHPEKVLVLGECGWATMSHTEGQQAELIASIPNEEEQSRFVREFTEWTQQQKVPTYYFEAFDENWKGGGHPDEVEKHWGLYQADRTPKPAMSVLQPLP